MRIENCRDRFYGKGCFHHHSFVWAVSYRYPQDRYFLWLLRQFRERWVQGISTSHIIFQENFRAVPYDKS